MTSLPAWLPVRQITSLEQFCCNDLQFEQCRSDSCNLAFNLLDNSEHVRSGQFEVSGAMWSDLIEPQNEGDLIIWGGVYEISHCTMNYIIWCNFTIGFWILIGAFWHNLTGRTDWLWTDSGIQLSKLLQCLELTQILFGQKILVRNIWSLEFSENLVTFWLIQLGNVAGWITFYFWKI